MYRKVVENHCFSCQKQQFLNKQWR